MSNSLNPTVDTSCMDRPAVAGQIITVLQTRSLHVVVPAGWDHDDVVDAIAGGQADVPWTVDEYDVLPTPDTAGGTVYTAYHIPEGEPCHTPTAPSHPTTLTSR